MKKRRIWPLHVYAGLLIPLACIQHWMFPGIPNYYLQHVLIYPSLLFMGWAWWAGLWDMKELRDEIVALAPWVLALFVFQGIAMWRSAELYPVPQQSTFVSVVSSLGKLAAQFPFFLFFYTVVKVLLRNEKAVRFALYGAFAAFLILTTVCSIQGMYIYSLECTSPIVQRIHAEAENILRVISPWVEARWIDPVYDFYREGGYALTGSQPRMNGIFEEASMLSVWLGTFFLPLGIGILGAYEGKRKSLLWGGLFIVGMSLLFLIVCRSTTGQVLAFIGMGILVWNGLRASCRKRVAPVLFLMCCGLVYIAFTGPHIQTYFLYKFKYADKEIMPRVVIPKDTLDIIIRHPLLGTGRGWYYPYVYDGERFRRAVARDLELQTWKRVGKGGQLSELPALTAQFGIPAVLLVLFVVGKMWWKLSLLRQKEATPWLRGVHLACTAWIILGLVAGFGILDMRNPLFCLPFFGFHVLSQDERVKAWAKGGRRACPRLTESL